MIERRRRLARKAAIFEASSFSATVPRIQKRLKIEGLHWRPGCSGRGPSMTNAMQVDARFANAEHSPDAVRHNCRVTISGIANSL